MKGLKKVFILLCVAALTTGCSDALDKISDTIFPEDELIVLSRDTFHVEAENVFADYIYSRSDSFLLGNYHDSEFGNTRAEILAQFAAPEGYTYPADAVLDSVCLYVYYNSLYGYKNSSIRILAYEMDLNTFSYSKRYKSNTDPADYCSKSRLLGESWVSTAHPTDSVYNESLGTYTYYVRIPLDTAFARAFFTEGPKHFGSQEDFCNYFKGLYLTTDFGTSSMVYVTQLDMAVFYHFQYSSTNINGEEYTKTSYDSRIFPANSEVRQVNVFSHNDREAVVARLNQVDTLCYISSPANIYTRLKLPTKTMVDSIESAFDWKKRCYVNGAKLKVELVDVDTTAMSSAPKYMLLVKENSMDRWFEKKEEMADTCAILGQLAYSVDSSSTNVTCYYYSFDMSGFLNHEMRLLDAYSENKPTAALLNAFYAGQEVTNWVMVPVEVETSSTSSTTINAVRHLYTMSSTRIRSGKNASHPLRISMVWTGF